MRARLHSWRQYIRRHWVATIVIVFVGVIVLIILGYLFKWDWTGFNNSTSQITIISNSKGNYTATVPQLSKSLWDWLGLLAVLAIPVVVGLGAAWYTSQQGKVADAENKDNQRETALEAYLDKMSELLLEKRLRESDADAEVRKIARVRTLTILLRLDATRKRIVLQFLHEAGLINRDNRIIVLSGADIGEADLRWIHLENDDLAGVLGGKAHLSKAHLSKANLSGAHLSGANLSGADLSGSRIHRAKLSEVDLSGADLKDTAGGITNEELEKLAKSLKGASMPDGSLHP